jgi:hypothetical protein
VELAMRLRAAIKSGDPRQGIQITKSAMKFDRQIVAIALVNGARMLYSDDDRVETFAASCGLATKRVADLPVPILQRDLFEKLKESDDAGVSDADDGEEDGL